MKRTAKKNSGIGVGAGLGIAAGVAAAGALIYAATRPSDPAPAAPVRPVQGNMGLGSPPAPQYGMGNGNASMEQRFDAGAAEYLRTHPNI